MYVMAKEVTLCISIHKEYSPWHGLGMVYSKLPSCGESKLYHSKRRKLSFPVHLSRLSQQWMGKERFLQEAAVATDKDPYEMGWGSLAFIHVFTTRKTGPPSRCAQLIFTWNEKLTHSMACTQLSTQESFPGLYNNDLDPDQASPPNHLPVTLHQSKRNKGQNR